MDSALISKVQKARHYADDPSHFTFRRFEVAFHGHNAEHAVAFEDGKWSCDCEFFDHREFCSHTMALERLLENMLATNKE